MERGILLMVLALLSLAAAKVPVYDPHRDVAYSALDIRVVDDMGMPVPGADLCVSFAIGPVESIDRTGSTDGEGCFSASCDTTGSIWIRVLKDGYYRTRLHVDAQHVPYETARETRKWSDGSVTIPVVLKKSEIQRSCQSMVEKCAGQRRTPCLDSIWNSSTGARLSAAANMTTCSWNTIFGARPQNGIISIPI